MTGGSYTANIRQRKIEAEQKAEVDKIGSKETNQNGSAAGNHFWQVKNLAGNEAELILYGTISDNSWWGRRDHPAAVC